MKSAMVADTYSAGMRTQELNQSKHYGHEFSTNQHATKQGLNGHKVSSSYLTILDRHLSLVEPLKLKTRAHNGVEGSALSTASQCFTVDIEKIKPALRKIERQVGRANFGLDIGRNMHPSDYGIFAYAMMNCATLHQALHTAAQHKTILNQRLFASFIERDELVYYQINTDMRGKDAQILIELDFSTAFEFAKRLSGPSDAQYVKLHSVHFSHSPLGPIEDYEACFECPVYFNETSNRLVIERKELLKPIYGANPKILTALEDKISKVASKHDQEQAMSERVALFINKNMSGELPTASQVAAEFLMSVSLLKKRLNQEGTCYQKICDDVRFKRSMKLIKGHKASLKEVAFELGFANPSAFCRAFKKWTGQSPSQYRKLHY